MARETFKTLFCLLLVFSLVLINYSLYYTQTEQQYVAVQLISSPGHPSLNMWNHMTNASNSSNTYIDVSVKPQVINIAGRRIPLDFSTPSIAGREGILYPPSNVDSEPEAIDRSFEQPILELRSGSSIASPSTQLLVAGQETVTTAPREMLAGPSTAPNIAIDLEKYGISSETFSNGVRVISIPKNLKAALRPISIPGVDTSTDRNDTYMHGAAQAIRTAQRRTAPRVTVASTTAEITPKPPPPVNIETHRGGYVMVMKFYEQQTMASGNLLQLQCWARYLSMAVVKPFLYDSFLLTPLDDGKHSLMLRFEDVFDISHWNEHVESEGYAPLADWTKFIRYAPRSVIFVQFKHPLISTVKSIKAMGYPFPHPPKGDQIQTGCKFKSLTDKKFSFLRSAGFRVVRKVCFNFQLGDELTLEGFTRHLLGDYASSEVTVIMDEWHGLGETQRVLIQEKICVEKIAFREQVRPSQRIVQEAERYADKYLNGSKYLAVITRFEMTGLTHGKHNTDKEDPYAVIPRCLALTLESLRKLKAETGMDSTFLSIDIGKYGSSSFQKRKYYGHLRDMMEFVRDVYEGEMGVFEWERTFEGISSTKDAGYIAMLQQVLVTRAQCILFVGGGSFQRHTLHLYQQLHPRKEDQCVEVVKQCTSAYRPVE